MELLFQVLLQFGDSRKVFDIKEPDDMNEVISKIKSMFAINASSDNTELHLHGLTVCSMSSNYVHLTSEVLLWGCFNIFLFQIRGYKYFISIVPVYN